MGRLQQHDIVEFDTPHGWVRTTAVYDRDLPRGALLVHPGPWLAVDQGEVDLVVGQGRSFDFTFQVVIKAHGEPAEPPYDRDQHFADRVYVQDVHTPHVLRSPDYPSHGYLDEGFYGYAVPTLMHRVVETDSRQLAEVILSGECEQGPNGSTMDDVLVERPVRVA